MPQPLREGALGDTSTYLAQPAVPAGANSRAVPEMRDFTRGLELAAAR